MVSHCLECAAIEERSRGKIELKAADPLSDRAQKCITSGREKRIQASASNNSKAQPNRRKYIQG